MPKVALGPIIIVWVGAGMPAIITMALAISLIVTIAFTLIFGSVSIKSIFIGIVGSFAVAFISMYGWDTFNELIVRFKNSKM